MTIAVRAKPDDEVHDARAPLARLPRLLDPDSLTELHARDQIAVTAARGRIDGIEVIAFCTDATRKGGALGISECVRIAETIDLAARENAPSIGLWHSGGANLAGGIESMHGIGLIFAAMVRASGGVPQISVVLGPAAGGAAYGPALTDLIIMAPEARMFITGPDVIRSVTGEEIDMISLGGARTHSRKSGLAHLAAESEDDAFSHARRLVTLLGRPGAFDTGAAGPPRDLRALLPESPRRAYDVRPLIRAIVDENGTGADDFVELHRHWAPNVVVGLGRLAGGTVGVVASNPQRRGGCLDSLAGEKAARFVRMCDGFGIPLLVLVDVPGFLPGVGQEWGGVVRRGAKLLYAFAEARVPRVTVVTRKSFGGAYIAMNSRSLGATAVFAWKDAEVGIMGAEAAVDILHRKQLAATNEDRRDDVHAQLVSDYRRTAGGLGRGVELDVIDEVIEPADTRDRLIKAYAEALAVAPVSRVQHGNIPL